MLFPTTWGRTDAPDKFRILFRTYRSDKPTTMPTPLRDYLRPKPPKLSPFPQKAAFGLAWLLLQDDQPGATGRAASRAVDLAPEEDSQFPSANVIAFLAGYTIPRARERRPSLILRRPSELHLISAGTIS